ncbi:MAG: MBG domain-containing protein, partial [Cyanobacteriota bacterium]
HGDIETGVNFDESSYNTEDIVNTENILPANEQVIQDEEIYLIASNDIKNYGNIIANNENNSSGNTVNIKSGNMIGLDNASNIKATGNNASILIDSKFVATGGSIDVSNDNGGQVDIIAGNLSLAGNIKAIGNTGSGGKVNIHVINKTWETTSSHIDVSGVDGGKITHIAGKQITTSGDYKAIGIAGKGGQVDITAPATKLLTPSIDASGETGGGIIRLGGEYQGGKNLEKDEIPNAKILTMTGGTSLAANANGDSGDGGTIITWADYNAIILGDYSATPGEISGKGGFVEISSGNTLSYGGTVQSSKNDRAGNVLFDPKNITIADTDYNQYSIIIGHNYDQIDQDPSNIESNDAYGCAVSIDQNMMAVGAYMDDDNLNLGINRGAVYLYSFRDNNFNEANLEGIIGDNYDLLGGKNLGAVVEDGDHFGRSVSLDNNRLAVGMSDDEGNRGAVYLFTFTDNTFSGGNQALSIGVNGTYDIILGLDAWDQFGTSVSLDGNRLAVGAPGDDGFTGLVTDSGAVYLYSFTSANFAGCNLEAIIGDSYGGVKDISQTLDIQDAFGSGIALYGNSLAVGARSDDGFGVSGAQNKGAVYLYSFATSDFSGGQARGVIGDNYLGADDLNITLDDGDEFGINVSLDTLKMAVGAKGDDGFSGTVSDAGAVYLFSYQDQDFTNKTPEAIIGNGYSGGNNKNITLDSGDNFGMSVSLDRQYLAVGAEYDDGYANTQNNTGAVYLLASDNSNLDYNRMIGRIGSGYTSTNYISQNIANADNYGCSVSIDGNSMAVGANGDDGFTDMTNDSGAVYLYSFYDSTFTGAVLEGIIGEDYNGGRNINIWSQLEPGDLFGTSVSLDNNRLAVGATSDDGFGNLVNNSGAVYLFTFNDKKFNNGLFQYQIGDGYAASGGVSEPLVNDFKFGQAVSLDGTRLVVGYDDDAAGVGTGAVNLYTFTGLPFTACSKVGTIGSGYLGPNDINETNIEGGDGFGISVSLDGNRLAVGSEDDDGRLNLGAATGGAVYLYSFTDSLFNGGTREAIIGENYTIQPKDININLDNNDRFGVSVALENNSLAVGARGDSGFNNNRSNAGAVYLFTFTDSTFSGGNNVGTIGFEYNQSPQDVHVSLGNEDWFGGSVSLNQSRLAIGACQDDGKNIDNNDNPGAVYLFTFADENFNNPELNSIIGRNYDGKQSISQTLENADGFGSSVSIDGDRLAIGAAYDDGFGNIAANSGAVYLYTFTGSTFSNVALEGIIGDSYIGGGNYNLQLQLDPNDQFGFSVSLDGERLAVGAPHDAGIDNLIQHRGAVYLFTFNDNFNNLNLEGIIGNGYVGPKDVPIVLNNWDEMGSSVSLDGNRLATGLVWEDSMATLYEGAVFLFTFTDSAFAGGNLEARIGCGFGGPKDINVAGMLDASDGFGMSVALEGTQLAITAVGDDGFNNLGSVNGGAVYLYTFTDTVFSGGVLQGRIGDGYSGANDINFSFDSAPDYENTLSVSLNNNRLAIGAPYDNGFNNLTPDSGAVYIYTFNNSNFSGGSLEKTIGYEYTGNNNINVPLDSNDFFGRSVSLDGDILAVGSASGRVIGGGTNAKGDDGFNNTMVDVGAVRLFTIGGNPIFGNMLFTDNQSSSVTISSQALADLLVNQVVILQANNDIFLNSDLIVDNTAGSGNDLSLMAGRSIYINGNINTDEANLTLIANATIANGVINAERDSGPAEIVMAPGTIITTNTGDLLIDLRDGLGKTFTESGNIVLNDILSRTIRVYNNGPTANSDVVINAGAIITGNGVTNPLAISTLNGNVANNSGPLAIVTPFDRWLIYSSDPANTLENIAGYSKRYSETISSLAPIDASINDGNNYFIYNISPTLTFTAVNESKDYGDPNPMFTYNLNGLIDGDAEADAVTGAASITSPADGTSVVGSYLIDIEQGGLLLTNMGYQFNSFVDGTLTVTQRDITITIDDQNMDYGDDPSAILYTANGNTLVNGDTIAGDFAPVYNWTTASQLSNAGTTHTITGVFTNSNYNVTALNTGNLLINPAILNITTNNASKVYGSNNPVFTSSINGFVLGQDESVLNGSLGFNTLASITSSVGTYSVIPYGVTANNYVINFISGNLTIIPANLTVTANNSFKIYGMNNPSFTSTISGFVSGDNRSSLSGVLNYSTSAKQFSNPGNYFINPYGLSSSNYNIQYVSGILTIDPISKEVFIEQKSESISENIDDITQENTSTAINNISNKNFKVADSSGTNESQNIDNNDSSTTMTILNAVIKSDKKPIDTTNSNVMNSLLNFCQGENTCDSFYLPDNVVLTESSIYIESSDHEYDADLMATEYLSRMGYHPAALEGALITMKFIEDYQKKKGIEANNKVTPTINYRHPETVSRISKIDNKITKNDLRSSKVKRINKKKFVKLADDIAIE